MSTGGSHTNFNGGQIVGAGLCAGASIGGALLQGAMNYRAAVAEQRRRESRRRWNRMAALAKDSAINAATAHLLGLRLNAEVDKTAAQALAIEALRRENKRLRGL